MQEKNITESVVCHNGKCRYKNPEFLDECIDCDVLDQIEHDLLRSSIGRN